MESLDFLLGIITSSTLPSPISIRCRTRDKATSRNSGRACCRCRCHRGNGAATAPPPAETRLLPTAAHPWPKVDFPTAISPSSTMARSPPAVAPFSLWHLHLQHARPLFLLVALSLVPHDPHSVVTQANSGLVMPIEKLNLSATHSITSPTPKTYRSTRADPH